MKEVAPSPDDETLKEHDMMEPQEPSHKRNTSWACEIIQEEERYGAPEGSIRKSKKLNPFPSYVDLMCDIVEK